MPGSKAPYLEFCNTHYAPLHFQPWWLDAVCGPDAWGAAYSGVHQGLPSGILPYFKSRRWGLPVIQLPPLTAYAGPWLLPINSDVPVHKRLGQEHKRFQELIDQIPKTFFFQQCFRPEIHNWLPFYWAGYKQTQRYTYVLPAPLDLAGLYANLKGSVRTDLRRAEQFVEMVRVDSPEALFDLHSQSFGRKNRRPAYALATFDRLHKALSERGQGQGFLALDRKKGKASAGVFLAFDSQQAALLLTGFNPEFRHSGALNALYWEAIRFCAERNLSLDFEGSMLPGVERVFRAFGGELRPYFQVWRAGNTVLNRLF